MQEEPGDSPKTKEIISPGEAKHDQVIHEEESLTTMVMLVSDGPPAATKKPERPPSLALESPEQNKGNRLRWSKLMRSMRPGKGRSGADTDFTGQESPQMSPIAEKSESGMLKRVEGVFTAFSRRGKDSFDVDGNGEAAKGRGVLDGVFSSLAKKARKADMESHDVDDDDDEGSSGDDQESRVARKHRRGQALAFAADFFIGFAEGFTMPFVLVCSVSVFWESFLVLASGLAFVCARSIFILTDTLVSRQSVAARRKDKMLRYQEQVMALQPGDETLVQDIFAQYGIDELECAPVSRLLYRDEQMLVEFLTRVELGRKQQGESMVRSLASAFVAAVASIVSGILVVVPYAIIDEASHATYLSAALTSLGLFIASYIKGRVSGGGPLFSAVLLTATTISAGALAFGIARGIQLLELHHAFGNEPVVPAGWNPPVPMFPGPPPINAGWNTRWA